MNPFSSSYDNRHYGLDVVRASSLLMILVVHCMIFVGAYYPLTPYLYFGVLAVELFFVLSGFLIGLILIKISQNGFSMNTLRHFWLKRWLRTLPAYLVVITIIMVVDGQFYGSFLLFLQNYVPEQLKEFPVSWTISLEEWFYLTFPLILFMAHRLNSKRVVSNKTLYLICALFYVLAPWLARLILLANGYDGNWDINMRKSIFIRFDTIGYGLLLAWVYKYYQYYLLKTAVKNTAIILMLLITAATWWLYNDSVDIYSGGLNTANSLIVFPAVNWICVCAIIYALHFEHYKNKILARFITTISITSYSLYLVHFQIFLIFLKGIHRESQAWLHMLIAVLFTFIAGFILNMTVERYFIRKRDKWLS